MSTTAYIRFVRISVACELLLKSTLAISEIALRTGFQNLTDFQQMFKEVYGCNPTVFRQEKDNPKHLIYSALIS